MERRKEDLPQGAPFVIVGTYTGGASDGIYVCRLDLATGELRDKRLAGRCENPSYLAINRERNRLFAVNEVTTFDGQPAGAVSAFVLDSDTGQLTLINQVSTHGGAPCYITLEEQEQHLLVANYVGGNVAVIPIDRGGSLGAATDVVSHAGSSVHPARQAGPHPHSAVLDGSNAHAYVPDLGLDRIVQYRFDRSSGTLRAKARTAVTAGAGPRHMVFHPTGRFAFVINELNSTVAAFSYDLDRSTLTLTQTISMLPDHYDGPNIAADLHLRPDGRFLYASNRGHDTVAVFAIDGGTGRLTFVDSTPTQGKTPRGFTIDPSGSYLLVANQDSDTIVVFAIDGETGRLHPTGDTLDIPTPVCLKIISPPSGASNG